MSKKRYNGVDYTSKWKLVHRDGKTVSRVVKGVRKPLTGFSGYQEAAKYAVIYGGTPIRE